MRHASSLRRVFRHILIAAAAGPLPLATIVACTAGVAAPDTYQGATGEGGTGSNNMCRAAATVDAPSCGNFVVPLAGDINTCDVGDGGSGSLAFCMSICGSHASSFCTLSGGAVMCLSPCAVDGRRYTALDESSAPHACDVPSYLARMAFSEAASIDAFTLLARELTEHGAPSALVRSCKLARRDEVRHAAMATKLARRHGAAVVLPPALLPARVRTLEAIAIENAVEGCIRETFGALIGAFQAAHAPTATLRGFFSVLAHDEARHAALAGRVDRWLESQLSRAARRRVAAARDRAAAEIEATLATQPVPGLGLPDPRSARALFAAWAIAASADGAAIAA